MTPPRGLVGILVAFISFLCVGMPLYEHGMPFLPCFLIQVGVMALLVLVYSKIEDKINKRKEGRQ